MSDSWDVLGYCHGTSTKDDEIPHAATESRARSKVTKNKMKTAIGTNHSLLLFSLASNKIQTKLVREDIACRELDVKQDQQKAQLGNHHEEIRKRDFTRRVW